VIVDAHVHVACADAVRYPRQPSGVGSPWWTDDGDLTQLRGHLAAHGVARAVIVQSTGLYGHDCRCAADVVAAEPERYALVPTLDMGAPDLAAEVARYRELGATGVRMTPEGGPGQPSWLADGRGLAVWEAAAAQGLVVTPMVRSCFGAALADLCHRVPEATVVLDHCGMSFLDGPEGDQELRDLASAGSLLVKVSTENLAHGGPGWLAWLVGVFGPERVVWGSDYPQHREHRYPEMFALAEAAVADLDGAARDAVMGATAARLFWPERADAPTP
jgi:L-fuconolactonase